MADGSATNPPAWLTAEEHKARAILMGMVYFEVFGYYSSVKWGKTVRIDAETLQPISSAETNRRIEEALRRLSADAVRKQIEGTQNDTRRT